jgi:enoyl-CoA hydratase
MEYKTFLLEKEGKILKVIFNNPEKLNALTDTFLQEFTDLLDKIDAGEVGDVQVVILTGAGKAFIAGADITLMRTMSPAEAAEYSRVTTEVYRKMEASKKIFIAAINGFAFGGGFEMSLACDLRVASAKAKMGLPEVSLGIFPGGGGTQRLPRLIGAAKAKELIFTAKTITATQAYEMGILNEVCEPDELEEKAKALAEAILANSCSGVSLAKEAMNNGLQSDIISAMNLEKNLFALCFGTDDQIEGMNAFVEKRKANFK